jgi:CRISPR-associated protein Cas1
MLLPLKPPSMIFVQYGQIDVQDGAFVVIDQKGVRMHIPVGSMACIMLEPGTPVSHTTVHLASTVGTLLVWVGEGGVRLYANGQPGGARADQLLYQAKLALDDDLRLKVVRKMYELRFKEPAPVEQLCGIEGVRVRETYKLLAKQCGVDWQGRNYDQIKWDATDVPNCCLSVATSCLYGIIEAAVLAAGYTPAVGFIHTGKPLSFVYDVADLFKFDTVVPVAFASPPNYRRSPRGKYGWPVGIFSVPANCWERSSQLLRRCWPPEALPNRKRHRSPCHLLFLTLKTSAKLVTGCSNELSCRCDRKRPAQIAESHGHLAARGACRCLYR